MVSKVTLSVLVLCLCLSQSLQSPDHNRTRREDKPGLSPNFKIEDLQGWFNVMSQWFPGGKKDKEKVNETAPGKDIA